MFRNRITKIWNEATDKATWQIYAAVAVVLLLACAVFFAAMRPEHIPDFREFTAGPDRKAEFFGFVQPLIKSENQRIMENRRRLQALDEEDDIGWFDSMWLSELAGEYGIDAQDMAPDEIVDVLLRRVDVVPESLALAQAAKESGWGTSRFAREGNNLFGEWCFDPGCGIVPTSRTQGRTHEVEFFSTPEESIRSYLTNLNTHASYKEFRSARARMRVADKSLSGPKLAEHLDKYSERRLAYVDEIKRLIRTNDLASLDAPAPTRD